MLKTTEAGGQENPTHEQEERGEKLERWKFIFLTQFYKTSQLSEEGAC